MFDEPVYNYPREFPIIWQKSVPIPYRADQQVTTSMYEREPEHVRETGRTARVGGRLRTRQPQSGSRPQQACS